MPDRDRAPPASPVAPRYPMPSCCSRQCSRTGPTQLDLEPHGNLAQGAWGERRSTAHSCQGPLDPSVKTGVELAAAADPSVTAGLSGSLSGNGTAEHSCRHWFSPTAKTGPAGLVWGRAESQVYRRTEKGLSEDSAPVPIPAMRWLSHLSWRVLPRPSPVFPKGTLRFFSAGGNG